MVTSRAASSSTECLSSAGRKRWDGQVPPLLAVSPADLPVLASALPLPALLRKEVDCFSVCTSPAAPRRSLLQTCAHSIGSLKQSKLCVWRKRAGKNKAEKSQHDGAVSRLLFWGITSMQLVWRTRTFFFAVRHPVPVPGGNLDL